MIQIPLSLLFSLIGFFLPLWSPVYFLSAIFSSKGTIKIEQSASIESLSGYILCLVNRKIYYFQSWKRLRQHISFPSTGLVDSSSVHALRCFSNRACWCRKIYICRVFHDPSPKFETNKPSCESRSCCCTNKLWVWTCHRYQRPD